METELIRDIFECDKAMPQILRDSLLQKITENISQAQLEDICTDFALECMESYRFKPVPVKPLYFAEYDNLDETEKRTFDRAHKNRLDNMRSDYGEHCRRVEACNSANLRWLLIMQQSVERRLMEAETERVGMLIAEFIF